MPKVHVRASQCAHIASLDADTSFIVDANGPRWALTSSNNQSMVVFKADIISMEDFDEDVIYELSDTVLDMFKTCPHGVVVISIRAQKVSFTHDYDQLIRRVSDTLDEERSPFFIAIGASKAFEIRYDHWKRMMPMLQTDVVRADLSPKTVTFSGDECGAACATVSNHTKTFEMYYHDWKFVFDRWPSSYRTVEMGEGENGVLYMRCDGVEGFMSPVL